MEITNKSKALNNNSKGIFTKPNDDATLKVTWNTNKNAIKGKVFRKKQDSSLLVKNQSKINKETPSPFQKHTLTSTNAASVKKTCSNPPAKSPASEYITRVNVKRKYKKDKQKAQTDENELDDEVKISNKGPIKSYSLFNEKPKDVYVGKRTGKSCSEKVFTESGSTFSTLPIHKHLVSNLEKIQFTTLTTVQEKAIPIVITGKDVLIRSQTGSGKTLAYAVPIVDALQSITPRLQRKNGVQAIVVVPTRELALQTHELFSKINTFQWIVTGHLCGGENRKSEKERLRKGIHILIGTPGRLLDHVLHTTALKVDKVRCLVLDEADRLLDMGFRKDIISLVEALDNAHSQYDPMQMLKKCQSNNDDIQDEVTEDAAQSSLRNFNSKSRQTVLLSATLSKGVSELADFTMKNHVYIDAFSDEINSTHADSLVIPNTVKQEFLLTYVKHRLFTLTALLVAKSKQRSKIFVFMASTQMVEYHYELFTRCLLKMPVNRGKLKKGNVVLFDVNNEDSESEAEEVVLDAQFFKLHGNMDQKSRKQVFTSFREAKSGILLCTDVAARGLDVPSADCIVQYTGPQTDEDYLHRVGRTGRAGQLGSAIIFLTHEEQEYVTRLGEQRVFLKRRDTEEFVRHLCDIMEETDAERAAEALQRRYETAVVKSKELHLFACLAYSTWSRFYNTYPAKMRSVFNFKNINLGHYATSFALRDTPSQISRTVRGEVANVETPRLNKKLANHADNKSKPRNQQTKQKRSLNLITSEYSSGLEPAKKKRKKNENTD